MLRFSLRDVIASNKVCLFVCLSLTTHQPYSNKVPEIFYVWKYDDVVDDTEDSEWLSIVKHATINKLCYYKLKILI